MSSEPSLSLANIATNKANQRNQPKVVQIPDKFYQIFNEDEIVEIINDLRFKRQIKLKYNYYADGAQGWSDFYFESPITKTINDLKNLILDNLLYFVSGSNLLNIIDVGPGNAYPVKEWLTRLYNSEILGKYVSVDISDDINNLVEKNVKEWFPNIRFAKYRADIEQTDIARVLIESKIHDELQPKNISNMILLLGNTLCNFDDRIEVFKNFVKSMDINDMLVFSYTNDIDSNKIAHNYIASKTSHRHVGWIAKMFDLNYDDKYITTTYDSKINSRVKFLTLNKDYILNFKILNHTVPVKLRKGETINLWKHHLISEELLKEQLDEVGLELVFKQYDYKKSIAIVACRIKDPFNQRLSE